MPRIDTSYISCGVEQLYDLYGSPRDCIRTVKAEWNENIAFDNGDTPFAFLMFSDTVNRGKGRALAQYIRDHKLGAIKATQPKTNPNSGNMIQVWVWSVDWAAIKRFK